MNNILVEICCASADDVVQAQKGGAMRVELNSSLFHGGLTPSIGELIVAKELANIPIMAMARPREGGFCYSDVEFKTCLKDAEMMLKHGADGIVFGFLKENGCIDVLRCAEMLKVIGDKQSVFHRAIDVVPCWQKCLDELIELGVTRVLTSGQEKNVFLGTHTVRAMIKYAKGRIEILPGAGITLKNKQRIIDETGCNQIHLSAHKKMYDTSTENNNGIFYGGALYPPEDRYSVIDSEYVKKIVE